MNIKCNTIFFSDDVIKQNMVVVIVRIIDNVSINNIIGTYSKQNEKKVAGFTIFFSDDVIKQNMVVVMARFINNVDIDDWYSN